MNSLLPALLMYHCSHLYNVYNNNYNNNCSFVIFICLQPFCKPHLYFILHTTEMFKHATSHKTDWITTDCCPLCLAPLYIHAFSLQNVLQVEGIWSRLLEDSIVKACVYAFSYCLFRMLVVGCLFGRCSMYLCIVYTLTLVAFSMSFILMIMVFVAFPYCFHMNDIRSFRVTILYRWHH